jgi:hypothetical protein
MLTDQQRIILFLSVCIPLRIGLVLLARFLPEKYMPYLGGLLLLPAVGFTYLYFANKRLDAPEGGGKTWWASARLLHAVLFLTAAIYAIQKKKIAWVPLAIDVVLGFSLFLNNKYN